MSKFSRLHLHIAPALKKGNAFSLLHLHPRGIGASASVPSYDSIMNTRLLTLLAWATHVKAFVSVGTKTVNNSYCSTLKDEGSPSSTSIGLQGNDNDLVGNLQTRQSTASVVANADSQARPSSMGDMARDILDHDGAPKSEMSDVEYLIQSRRAFVGGIACTAAVGGCAICATGRNGRQRFFANMMSSGMADYEALPEVRQFKSQIFDGHISMGDHVLEIGIGSGPNIKYYQDKVGKLMALEPNREFDSFIIQSVAATDMKTKVDIVPGFAENIPKKDASVDVVSSFPLSTENMMQ